jgi:type II secretory pathway pseudopilin PulG
MPEDEQSPVDLAREIAHETKALNQLLAAYASKVEVEKLLRVERKKTKELIGQRDRFRNALLAGLALAVVVAVVCAVWATAFVRRLDDEARARESDRVERSITSCQQANLTRGQINKGNDAKVAIRDANASIQDEIDALLGPIVNPPTPMATTADFKRRYEEGRTAVERKLTLADDAITAAHVPLRDCAKPDDPTAFLPDSITTTTLGG